MEQIAKARRVRRAQVHYEEIGVLEQGRRDISLGESIAAVRTDGFVRKDGQLVCTVLDRLPATLAVLVQGERGTGLEPPVGADSILAWLWLRLVNFLRTGARIRARLASDIRATGTRGLILLELSRSIMKRLLSGSV